MSKVAEEEARSPRNRFLAKIAAGPNCCWQWTGAKNRNGYGNFLPDGRRTIDGQPVQRRYKLAHRYAYEQFVGPIPDGMEIDHLCKNPSCVNPKHLEAVSRYENIMRSDCFTAVHAKKTHCPKGHPYSGDNLFFSKDGARQCRACSRARYHENKAKRAR